MENKSQLLAKVNHVLSIILTGSAVESYGIMHQVLFVDFRDDIGNDNRLSVFCNVSSNILQKDPEIDNIIYGINCLHKSNLCFIDKAICGIDMSLEITFTNGSVLLISGESTEESPELWQINAYNRFVITCQPKHCTLVAVHYIYGN